MAPGIHVPPCWDGHTLMMWCACSAAAQHSQQDRARAQLMAEEAVNAWQIAFPEEDAQQHIDGRADGSGEHPPLDFAADFDDTLLVSDQLSQRSGAGASRVAVIRCHTLSTMLSEI